MRFHVLTVVWGDEFITRLLNLTLRSLLAPGNLPDLAGAHELTYHIYAPLNDQAKIKSHPVFAAAGREIEFKFREFSLSDIDAQNSMSHWTLWQTGVSEAHAEDACVILVAPDHIFCRNTLTRWARHFEQGFFAVFSPGFQVSVETLEPELQDRLGNAHLIDLSEADLRDLMFRHLHPIKISMFRSNPRNIAHPEWHLRAVAGGGFVQSILSSHAVAFRPGKIRMTDNFCPVEMYEHVVFDSGFFLGAEPMMKFLGLYLRPWRMDEAALSRYGVWADKFILPIHARESTAIRSYPLDGDELLQAEKKREEYGARFYVSQLYASRTLYRLWKYLRENRLVYAARWLAAADIYGRLRRRLLVRGPVTVFVPDNATFDRLESSESNQLLALGGAALVDAVRAHVADGHLSLAVGDRLAESANGSIVTRDGRRLEVDQRGSVEILRGPLQLEGVRIYVVDGVLSPRLFASQARRTTVAGALHLGREELRRLTQTFRQGLIAFLLRRPRLLNRALVLRDMVGFVLQPGSKNPAREPNAIAVNFYRRALAARAVIALKEIYGYFEHVVLQDHKAAASQLLETLPAPSLNEIAHWLNEATSYAPDFAEAWLELGYVKAELDEIAGAIEAFLRAEAATPSIATPREQPDVRALAAYERAIILERLGRLDEALNALSKFAGLRHLPWRFHLQHASLLIKLGRAAEAYSQFERCFAWSSLEPRFTGLLPRDPNELMAALQVRNGPSPASSTLGEHMSQLGRRDNVHS